jgi:hypothetical protein
MWFETRGGRLAKPILNAAVFDSHKAHIFCLFVFCLYSNIFYRYVANDPKSDNLAL